MISGFAKLFLDNLICLNLMFLEFYWKQEQQGSKEV